MNDSHLAFAFEIYKSCYCRKICSCGKFILTKKKHIFRNDYQTSIRANLSEKIDEKDPIFHRIDEISENV